MANGFERGESDAFNGEIYDDSVNTDEYIPSSYGTGFIMGYGGGYISTYDQINGDRHSFLFIESFIAGSKRLHASC